MKSARRGPGEDTASLARADGFIRNLERAASGEPDAQDRMGAALQTATLRDRRYHRQPDSWRRYYADRAAERTLTAIEWYRRRFEECEAREMVRRAA